ncbi:MAG: hypothetical protein P3B98_04345 [Gemmatimonadota bacterium]|nr:hypothetical protein [Gemmatimonadota bacterium]
MRTIKFLGIAVVAAAVAVPALAQGTLKAGDFPAIDRLAQIEARRIEHRQQFGPRNGRQWRRGGMVGLRQGQGAKFRGGQVRGGQFRGAQLRGGQLRGAQGARPLGVRPAAGRPMSARPMSARPMSARPMSARPMSARPMRGRAMGGRPMGARANAMANATPAQKAYREQRMAQRHTIRAQVLEGKLTREQARVQMKQWALEHRPKG